MNRLSFIFVACIAFILISSIYAKDDTTTLYKINVELSKSWGGDGNIVLAYTKSVQTCTVNPVIRSGHEGDKAGKKLILYTNVLPSTACDWDEVKGSLNTLLEANLSISLVSLTTSDEAVTVPSVCLETYATGYWNCRSVVSECDVCRIGDKCNENSDCATDLCYAVAEDEQAYCIANDNSSFTISVAVGVMLSIIISIIV